MLAYNQKTEGCFERATAPKHQHDFTAKYMNYTLIFPFKSVREIRPMSVYSPQLQEERETKNIEFDLDLADHWRTLMLT